MSLSPLYTLDSAKQLSQFIVDRWSQANGMPNNSVKAICPDSQGYLWLATYNGLVQYDGNRMRIYNQRNTPSLPTNSLLSLAETPDGSFWLGTNGSGLLVRKGEHYERVKAIPESAIVTVLLPDPQDEQKLWVGTTRGLYCLIDQQSIDFFGRQTFEKEYVAALSIQKNGNFWIGTLGKGLWRLSDSEIEHFNRVDGLPHMAIRALGLGPQDEVWIGTDQGIALYRAGKLYTPQFDLSEGQQFINDIQFDFFGNTWLGTDDGFVRILRNADGSFSRVSGSESLSTIECLFFDRFGNLWMGSYEEGLLRLKDGKFKNYTPKQGLPSPTANVILPEGDSVWVGTNNGLALLRDNEVAFPVASAKNKKLRVRDMLRTHANELLLATYDGVYEYKAGKLETYEPTVGLSVRRLVESAEGALWIGSKEGLYVLEKGKLQPLFAEEFGSTYIMDIFIIDKENVWIATDGRGVFFYNGQELQRYSVQQGLASNVVFEVFQDSRGRIWAATNNGISLFSDGRFRSVNERDGLIANTIFQILEDEHNNFWLTTSQGILYMPVRALLSMFDGKTPTLSPANIYTEADGLAHTQVTASSRSARSQDGRLWFATLGGVSSLDPAQVPVNLSAPKVVLEEVMADGLRIRIDEKGNFVVPAGTQHLAITYTAFSYYDPQHTTFRYRLKGFDREWQEVGTRRKAYYTNLKPGSYQLQIEARNEDGVASKPFSSSPIILEAFFFEQPLVQWGLLIFLGVLALGFYRLRLFRLKLQNKKLVRHIEEGTSRIRQQNEKLRKDAQELESINLLKDKLLSIISHDLRGPLTSAMGLLNLVRAKEISKDEFSILADGLTASIQQQVDMLDNLLHWSNNQLKGESYRPVLLSLYQVIENILLLFQTDAQRKQIKLINQVDPAQQAWADVDMLTLVLRNLIGNAIKFAYQSGEVCISVQQREGALQLEVSDDGMGMDSGQLARIFKTNRLTSQRGTFNERGTGLGLSICKEFVERWGGRIWAESYPNKGSKFKFTIAVPQAGQIPPYKHAVPISPFEPEAL